MYLRNSHYRQIHWAKLHQVLLQTEAPSKVDIGKAFFAQVVHNVSLYNMAASSINQNKTYIVEHLDQEFGPWSTLEYLAIARECADAGASFCLSSVPKQMELPQRLREITGVVVDSRGVEEIFAENKSRVCLLDPAATSELSPDDGAQFDVFLFGGILGARPISAKDLE